MSEVTIEWQGKEYNINSFSRFLGINYGTLKGRLSYGWSIEKIVNTPVQPRRLDNTGHAERYEYKGKLYILQELSDGARDTRLSPPIISGRIRSGWTVKEAVEVPYRKSGVRCKKYNFGGKQMTAGEICEEADIHMGTFYYHREGQGLSVYASATTDEHMNRNTPQIPPPRTRPELEAELEKRRRARLLGA